MTEFLSAVYFVGLVMFGAAVGSHANAAEPVFMIVGSGAILYAVIMGIASFLHKKE